MSRLFYGHIQTNDITLHYYRTSDEKPTLVMLHGLTDYGLCWGRVAYKFNLQFDTLLPDARGHGLSSAPETGYSVEELAGDAAVIIGHLKLEPSVIIGHSLGAATAAALAANYPRLVRALVLVDPPYRQEPQTREARSKVVDSLRAEINAMKMKSIEQLIAEGKEKHPDWEPEDVHHWAKARLMVQPQAAAAADLSDHNWRQVIAQIQCPTLLVTGDTARYAIVSPQVADEFVNICKTARYVRIENAGHSIYRDQYKPFIQALQRFLFFK